MHKIYLVYLHNVQCASAGDHFLYQVEFSYRFLQRSMQSLHCHFIFQLSFEHDLDQFYSKSK